MKPRLEGSHALVCASSRGLGRPCAVSLAGEGASLPHEFGDACALPCSARAGFINGQNLLLGGGSYPGTF